MVAVGAAGPGRSDLPGRWQSHTVTGVGYHDHNWGNAPMLDLMHHCYWARSAAGPYYVTRYTFTDGDERYVTTFTRYFDIASDKFIDNLKGPKKLVARLARFDGAYLRFAGELRVEHYRGRQLVESRTNDALWELMYFGKARP